MKTVCAAALAALVLPASAAANIAYLRLAQVIVGCDDGRCGGSPEGYALPSALGGRVKLSPSGQAVAVLDQNRNLVVIDVPRKRHVVFKHPSSWTWLDATTLAVSRPTRFTYEVWLVRASGGAHLIWSQRVPCGTGEGGCQFPDVTAAASPDGKRIAVYGDPAAGLAVITRTGHVVFHKVPPAFSIQTTAVAWRPGGTALAAAEFNTKREGGQLALVSGRGARRVLLRSTRNIVSPAWAPDGEQIGFGRMDPNDGTVQLGRYAIGVSRVFYRAGHLKLTAGGIGAWISPTRWLVGYQHAIRTVDPTRWSIRTDPVLVKTSGAFDWRPTP